MSRCSGARRTRRWRIANRLFNEAGYLPERVRLKLDRPCIDSAVRTGRNLPNYALLFINILGSTLIQLTTLLGEFTGLLGMLRLDPGRIVFERVGNKLRDDRGPGRVQR